MIIQFYALSCFATKKKLPIATVMPWILNAMQMTASYYLKMNRIEYYDRMTQVRRTGDYEQWVTFFLQAFADSAEDAIRTIDQLTALHDKSLSMFDTLTKRQRTSVLKVFT